MTHTPHAKRCFARAVICAVENIRDADYYAEDEFYAALADIVVHANSYYDSGLIDCLCYDITT